MITVCVATHNGEKYIEEQLTSILSQLGDDDEVIISDDASTDTTLDIIDGLHDRRITVLHHHPCKALFPIDRSSHNFENALSRAHGEYIFMADQDDVWLPGKVNTMMEALQEHSLVMADCKLTDSELNVTNPSYFSVRKMSSSIVSNLLQSSFLGSSMSFRREILDDALPLPEYGVGHDLWLGLISILYFDVTFVRKPLTLYRRHGSTVTVKGNSLAFKLRYRAYLVTALIRRMLLIFSRRHRLFR
jgi:glycosyltransferase involved in cell wall biosynthesis